MVHENLNGRVAVITGGGGVLCSGFAKDLAAQGVKVAILDLREEAAQKVADEIKAAGGEALAVGCNVLESESLEAAREKINAALGSCDILVNGAGGNSPLGTTTKDTLELEDIAHKAEGVKTFFDLDPKGIEFVFNLNFLGTLLTTQCFAKDMIGKENATILNISSMNAYRPLTSALYRTAFVWNPDAVLRHPDREHRQDDGPYEHQQYAGLCTGYRPEDIR